MWDSWVQPSRHCAWTIKYTLESFIENVLPIKYLYGRNQCQVQFISLFLHFNYTVSWDMKCTLIIKKLVNIVVTLKCFGNTVCSAYLHWVRSLRSEVPWNKPFMVNIAILNQRSHLSKSIFDCEW